VGYARSGGKAGDVFVFKSESWNIGVLSVLSRVSRPGFPGFLVSRPGFPSRVSRVSSRVSTVSTGFHGFPSVAETAKFSGTGRKPTHRVPGFFPPVSAASVPPHFVSISF